MPAKARGRGLVATLGFIALFGGLVGGTVLFILAMQRTGDAVDSFARAPIGCTTTLQFSETGTFYIYEESAPILKELPGGCTPAAAPDKSFGFRVSGPDGPVRVQADTSVEYAEGSREGVSRATVEITTPGSFELTVVGSDPSVVAAVGRDPQEGVDDARRIAIAVAVAGVLLGVMFLLIAGRRSRQAAIITMPDGPGYGSLHTRSLDGDPAGSAESPRPDQTPINPHLPPERLVARPVTTDDAGATSPWAPPAPTDRLDQ